MIEMGLASKKPVIVVLFTTSPKNGPWMQAANAVIMANYPQNGGAAAIADTLIGDISPGGRLPVSWHKKWNCTGKPFLSHSHSNFGILLTLLVHYASTAQE